MISLRAILAAAVLCLAAPALAQVAEFRDPENGFSISAPAFKKPAEGQTVARLLIVAPSDGTFASNLNVSVQKVAMTRDAFAQLSEEQFRAAGFRIRTKENRTVSGKPAVFFDYEGSYKGQSLRWLALAVALPDRVILATCTASAAAFDGVEPLFRKSLESLKLTP